MDIKTQNSVSGFIVGDSQLGPTKTGEPRWSVRVGQEQFAAAEGGGFNQLENVYFNLVQFGKAAQRSFAQFKPGDRFVAEGYLKDYEFTNREGEVITGTDFVVRKIGHDTAWTRYIVDREPRSTDRGAPEHTAQQHTNREHGAGLDAPDAEPSYPEAPDSAKSRSPRAKQLPVIEPKVGGKAAAEREAVGAEIPF